jgi:hypothetical protein
MNRYWGSLAFSFLTFLLPALYSTLSKLWVANIDSSQVVTTDVYTYLSVVAQILNDGLPRTAWLIIGDNSTRTPASRIGLSYTLVVFQALMCFIMTVIFVAAAESFAASFAYRRATGLIELCKDFSSSGFVFCNTGCCLVVYPRLRST